MDSLGRLIVDNIGTIFLTALVPIAVIEAFKMISNFPFAYKEGKCGFLTFITGSYLAPQNCKVIFDCKPNDGCISVCNVMSFTIKFYQRNFKPYPITQEDQLSVHIMNGSQLVPCSIEFGDLNPNLANVARVSFSAKKSGLYTINIFVGSSLTHIRGSPFKDLHFKPLEPSPLETMFINHCSTVVCTVQNFHALVVEMRDKFGNLCRIDSEQYDPCEDFSLIITEIVTNQKIEVPYYWEKQSGDISRISLLVMFPLAGIYHAIVSYKNFLLKNGDFNIVCLTISESETVQKCISTHNKSCCFGAKLLPSNYSFSFGGSSQSIISTSPSKNKPKNVFCYISPKQLTIKEFILKIIPMRITSFRLSPSTKFYFSRNYSNIIKGGNPDIHSSNSNYEMSSRSLYSGQNLPNEQLIIIDDGCQAPIELISSERNIIVAVFTHFLLNKIGGSETFQDKQEFFYLEVRRYHQKTHHIPDRIHIKVDREILLESSFRAMKSFGVSDWCRRFEIQFLNENGIDWGGLRREWYELLCKSLFEPNLFDIENPLFMRFKNDKQALIHPNPKAHGRQQYFEFAGKLVGKSLLDSALGSSCKFLVNARFSRSFLAQLIGLRVNYRYFEHDDPDLYVSKIKFILDNDVTNLDLNFTEEEYDSRTGTLCQTFDLIPNGSQIRVTEDNKLRYLDALAQYRLSSRVKDQIDAFIRGLNDLIPDHLLSIFDENELELLLCGAATYSVSDLKLNHIVTGSSYDFQKVVDWFWRSVSNFTDEEFARLLQFTTGCSHLPPGGFVDLNPRFQICSALTYGTLPTAHTCFNQICLPDYESFEEFDRSLRIAITEGNEGFGLV